MAYWLSTPTLEYENDLPKSLVFDLTKSIETDPDDVDELNDEVLSDEDLEEDELDEDTEEEEDDEEDEEEDVDEEADE